MAKVEIDDPFVEPDPFAKTDAEAKEACLAREAALESELAKCKATAAAAGSGSSHPSCAQCGILGKNGPGPFLSASEDRFGRLQGRMRRRWRRPGTCLLYYKYIEELEPSGNFKVEGAWRSWDKEC
ncbi:hypothetical protein J7337_012652 [Fusarium musae]|uniref:Uncharacterized protein n=1 Tax=Fusarium musae TaxID=1042133 RepID=A0A9P8D692_9HYPO|nr:hypothetical protein J7337_012652 [Fusarium musae]KAG9496076.1 hypothetical protein J7337_012652 [Fusarium musae]